MYNNYNFLKFISGADLGADLRPAKYEAPAPKFYKIEALEWQF